MQAGIVCQKMGLTQGAVKSVWLGAAGNDENENEALETWAVQPAAPATCW